MKTFIIASCLLAVAFADKFLDVAQVDFEESTGGDYKLNYVSKNASREEQRFVDGKVLGSYTYLDTDGITHKVTYVAAPEHGFTAESSDIPVPVPESPELIQARSNHLSLLAETRALNPKEIPEKPVDVNEVLKRLVVPEIISLPKSAIPAEDQENIEAKAVLLSEYDTVLKRLVDAYKRTL